jgi:WD40 repeat protein
VIKTIILWNLKAAKPIRVFKGHTFKVMAMAISKEGRLLATGSWDRTLKIWDVSSGKQLLSINHPTPVNSVTFADSDTSIISGSHDGKIRVWSVKSGRSKGQVQAHGMGITQLSLSPNGKGLLSSSIDTRVKLWDIKTLKERQVF